MSYVPIAWMSPLSILAVSMFDMACMVYSLREAQWRISGCLWIGRKEDHCTWFREWMRFMKDLKYLRSRRGREGEALREGKKDEKRKGGAGVQLKGYTTPTYSLLSRCI